MKKDIINFVTTPPYKNGFTLAEVLITLVIIGVIAAMTVPTLINKTQNQEFVSKLKKAYSTLAQATNQIIIEEGPVQSWVTSPDNMYNLYKKKLINAKDCSSGTGCFEQFNKSGYKLLNGDAYTVNNLNESTEFRRLILSDGVQIMFEVVYPLCDKTRDGSEKICAMIRLDINGERKPNTIGRDGFHFVLKKDGLYPAGCENSNECSKTGAGWGCACKVLREGAMNY